MIVDVAGLVVPDLQGAEADRRCAARASRKRKDVTLFVADFDTESALKKQLRVAQQSTFVVFKGGKEVGRSTGETDRAAIAALFDKAL